MRNWVHYLSIGLMLAGSVQRANPQAPAADLEFFETKVRPVLARNCYNCHGPDKQFSALRVDSREALLAGGKRGPAVVPGDTAASLLVKAVRHDGIQMPMGSKLKDQEIAAIEHWVERGAAWPETAPTSASSDRYRELVREHWAFQPVARTAPPETRDHAWSGHPLDRFLAAALEKAGLDHAAPASRRILARRASFVLTGLPASAAEIERFEADRSPRAFENLVDRLLASPRFGERWARHWLDLARYGETRGYEWNYEIIGAWRYRDYLIRAFNADVPYDQLIREQIAGDLLPSPRIDTTEQINESLIGTAFFRLGEAGHDDCIQFREIALDVVDNQIDALTKTFQGLTVSCARCHDHKLDPVTTTDYYSLYSILNSSRQVSHTIDTPQRNAAPIERLAALKGEIRDALAAVWTREAGDISRYLLATLPASAKKTGARDGDLRPERVEAWRSALAAGSEQMESPAYPWSALGCESAWSRDWFVPIAAEVAERYRTQQAERAAFNTANFEPFGDFAAADGGWYRSGMGLRQTDRPASGDFTVAPQGDVLIAGIYEAGLYTNLLSSRLNGALRSPYLPKDRKFVSLRIMGGQLGARRTVIDNCAIGENYKVLEYERPQWVKLDTFAAQERLPIFLELVTRWDNPRIPDRPGVLKKHQLELLETPRSYFGITGAVLHDVDEAPREDLAHLLPLFDAGAPASWEDLATRYQAAIGRAVANWAVGRATDQDARWLDWLVRSNLLSNRPGATPRLQELAAEYRRVEATLAEPRVVDGLADMGPGRDFPVLVGGAPKTAGPIAPRRFLSQIYGDQPFPTGGSGRLELAELIASPENPLTARVMVNRIWHHVFGRGLVASTDNLGIIGDSPSHPELLDYLAARFVEEGWSVKKLIRLLMTSQAFRQSGEIAPEAAEKDPQNTLLHHYPLRRLEAESVRDSILITSGKLRDSMFGPSTQPYRDEAKDYRRLFAGPLDGEGRRSIYLKVTRMEGPRFLETFDYPNPMTTRGNRDVTNVPAQALTMLNDPFVVAEAEALAGRVLAQPAAGAGDRIAGLFRLALGRAPDAAELERFEGLARELNSLHQKGEGLLGNREVWRDVAHAVLNLKEFLYIQ